MNIKSISVPTMKTSMHSSRMRTARLLTVSRGGGVCIQGSLHLGRGGSVSRGGVCFQGGLHLGRGGSSVSRGRGSASRGVCIREGWGSVSRGGGLLPGGSASGERRGFCIQGEGVCIKGICIVVVGTDRQVKNFSFAGGKY